MFSKYYFSKKIAKVISIILAFMVIFLMISSFIFKKKGFSNEENRKLAVKPKASVDSVLSGEYGKAYENYFADHFAFRTTFINLSDKFENFMVHFKSDDKVYIKQKTGDDFGGENIEEVERASKK